ncbi:MAG: PucR family transcriptional regulator [Solirubrobacterales bacterium]
MLDTVSDQAPSATVRAAMRSAAVALELDVESIAEQLTDTLHCEVAELPEDAASRHATRRAAADSTREMARMVSGTPLGPPDPPVRSILSARAMARSGQDARALVRVVHISHRVLLTQLQQRLIALDLPPDVLGDAVATCQQITFDWTDAGLSRLIGEYQDEHDRLARSGNAERARAIRAILAEDVVDAPATSRALRYDLARRHTALILWTESSQESGTLQDAANEVAAALGAPRPLVLAVAGATLWAWVATTGAPHEAISRLPGRTDGVSIALGEPAPGITGFRTSHEDAQVAHRVAKLSKRRAGAVTRYGEVRLAAMLATDLDRVRRFVRAQLGELAVDGDENRRLRATLKVFLDERGNRHATAERLGVHVNTVRNRLRTAEELLGDRFRSQPVELHAALAVADRLGPSVLD